VTAAYVNHISIGAANLGESVRFYTGVFGAEEIDTPNFGYPVQWLRLGDLQLHIFQRTADAPVYHHFALAVDDFDAVFRATRDLKLHDRDTQGHHLFELPSGQVQLYIRDPGGNLLEVNCPDAREVSEEIRRDIVRHAERNPQDESNRRARLYLGPVAARTKTQPS
jgi:catechol 2,3-dioxygenase-like lactoylglutathione lyase family enzyme